MNTVIRYSGELKKMLVSMCARSMLEMKRSAGTIPVHRIYEMPCFFFPSVFILFIIIRVLVVGGIGPRIGLSE